jgi:uncharacterized protein (DUF488 family)
MSTMSSPPLVSLGYEGLTVEELIAHLLDESVTVLIDVRLNPLSRKPGMSKRRLAAALEAAGIRYIHLRALGNPKENRAGLRLGEQGSRDIFRRMLKGNEGSEALQHVAELLDGETVALLCFERDPRSCHRQLVAEEVRRAKPSVPLVEI